MTQVLLTSAGLSAIAGAARAVGLFGIRNPWIIRVTRVERIVPLLGLAFLVLRSIAAGFPALAGSDAVLVIIAICILPATELSTRRSPEAVQSVLRLWAAAGAAGLFLLALFPGIASAPAAPVPALRSAWLMLHVGATLAGEAFFLVGAGAAVKSLLAERRLRLSPRQQDLHQKSRDYSRVAAAAISVGYPLFTLGALVFGALWAFRAWGRYWAWDPKEVWALVTWLVYTLYLHLQLIRGGNSTQRNRTLLNILAILGVLLALFTFVGVNLLFESIHSY